MTPVTPIVPPFTAESAAKKVQLAQAGQLYRSYGNELWEFDDAGLMRRRIASINDAPITADERRVPRP